MAMYHNNDFVYEAVANLENVIDVPIDIETNRGQYNAILNIKDIQFIVEAKSTMRTSNQGLVLSKLEELRSMSNRPVIFIADYISKAGASQLKERGINYIDAAGNAFISNGDLMIFVEGRKRTFKHHTNQSRAFQEAGIKTIFHLLNEPINLQDSYREIAQKADVSLGSVSKVMSELEDLNFILKTRSKRVLKNKKELLERWVVAYNEVLKPRILRKRMRFIDRLSENEWKSLTLKTTSDFIYEQAEQQNNILWGGEPGASILTGRLRPEVFTLFTNYEIPLIANQLRLVPDSKGKVYIYKKFWNDSSVIGNAAPALLIYADLINSGQGRNMEIANQIFENELQHIQ